MNKTLLDAAQNGKIAGAYFICGDSYETVQAEIDDFLLRVFCEKKSGCGVCGGCQKYLHRSHVDLIEIASPKANIGVEEVREIPMEAARRSYEGGYKAIVIARADTMTPQAQNALLKVIEEPPKNTVFLLGGIGSKNMLPTILSRCIILKICSNFEETVKRLSAEDDVPTVRARALAKFAAGDYFFAKQCLVSDFFAMRDDVILALSRLFAAKNKATSRILSLLLPYEKNLDILLAFAQTYLADVMLYKHTRSIDFVVNEDKVNEISQHAKQTDDQLTGTFECLRGLSEKRAKLAAMNVRLQLESLLFDILEVVL